MSVQTWNGLIRHLRQVLGALPDRRTGDNTQYTMEDIGSSAFSIFFTQSPSFLSFQRTMQQAKGRNNAQSLFAVEQIPSDNHIRQTLDPVPPETLFPVYDALLDDLHFLFVCKPESHQTLYDWVNLLEKGRPLRTLKARVKKGAHWQTYTYRYANQVPLADGDDALKVNWCEVTVTNAQGEVLYRNGFITDFTLTDENVAALVAAGRARWKIENENNPTLKTKGSPLEHNFGHGQQHLSSLLAALNILAFLLHTFLSFTDASYRLIRATLPTRKTFFDDLRALTRYLPFASWEALLDFMMRGLEIGPYATASPCNRGQWSALI